MKKEDDWFEKWVQEGTVYDKDDKKVIKRSNSQTNQPFKQVRKQEEKLTKSKKTPSPDKKKVQPDETHLLDQWLDDNRVFDKDKEELKPKSKSDPYQPFNDKKLDKTDYPNYRQTNKFFVEDDLSLDKWLDKNDVVDKDQDDKDDEIWKYPPENLYAVRIDSSIDLHRLTVNQALHYLHQFILRCYKKNDRVVKIIHGKGNHSGVPKLKMAVLKWLRGDGKGYVRLFKEADPKHGGAGATIAWLK